ncbi:hypothetical protein ACFQZE_06330 [Paenibacillus sp. GCM10027627]|uniref:hypothetical protein n=1 Tax=unclassified Paenibacillus TaxID=185978 RepID=UPI00363CADB7
MDLWGKLELRGREEFNLSDEWFMYAADASNKDNVCEIKFAKKNGAKWLTDNDFVGKVKYMDLQ